MSGQKLLIRRSRGGEITVEFGGIGGGVIRDVVEFSIDHTDNNLIDDDLYGTKRVVRGLAGPSYITLKIVVGRDCEFIDYHDEDGADQRMRDRLRKVAAGKGKPEGLSEGPYRPGGGRDKNGRYGRGE